VVAVYSNYAIYVADQARSLPEGMAKAEAALESGRVAALLDRVVEFSKTG